MSASAPDPRFFSLPEARRTLPLVRRIVADIVAAWPPLQARLRTLHERTRERAGDDAEMAALRGEVEREAEVVNGYLDELRSIGCLFKGFEEGLVDWYARWDGRTIQLCWKHDEDDISWWHEVETGFAGRRPLTAEMEDALSR
ncbi:MAG TPA: DUF2203 domain-containing protein [Longimicrobiales bacterium]|nr:DUF2203 domain-containing protein [Longimicrobiales bacterium]